MSDLTAIAEEAATATTWDARVALIRRVPELFGTGQQSAVYAAIAARVYQTAIEPDFAYIHWRDEYELPELVEAYKDAERETAGFHRVSRESLAAAVQSFPRTLRVFRLLLGLTTSEFGEACSIVAERFQLANVAKATVKTIESGGRVTYARAETCAAVIDLAMRGELFPPALSGTSLRRKTDKPDTADGWISVQRFAQQGVPLPVLLHQRAYGGAFRQLLDATSSQRGDVLEIAVGSVFRGAGIPHLRTGSHDQAEIADRFGLTVRPAPDFVIFGPRGDTLRAFLECKVANDGGTARDKASRFRSLRNEATRLGGVPVIAVLGGIGWRRSADALGPVVRDTDGRVFTVGNIQSIVEVEPFPSLLGAAR